MFVGSTAADYVGGGRMAHGISAFARHVAAETAKDGITVLTVVVGAVRTEAGAHVVTGALEEKLAANSVLGRVHEAADVAATIAVAASDDLRAATGSAIRVDAGWSVSVGGPFA